MNLEKIWRAEERGALMRSELNAQHIAEEIKSERRMLVRSICMHSPETELVRIARRIANYFYPLEPKKRLSFLIGCGLPKRLAKREAKSREDTEGRLKISSKKMKRAQ